MNRNDKKVYNIPIDDGSEPPRKESHPDPGLPAEIAGETAHETGAPSAEALLLDQLQRLQAEFANYRRRVDRERQETAAWAQKSIVESLLPVLDGLDRAAQSVRGDDSAAAQGLGMIRDKLTRALAEAGLERIEAEGRPFDPDVHEALLTQAAEPDQAGIVLAEIEPGYFFRGKLVRPARVRVGVDADKVES